MIQPISGTPTPTTNFESMPRYRADIDGLRAVAILSVCFYHVGIEWVPGGFVGVDVFFVISGFLMASTIGESLEKQRFTYKEFFEKRVRRLLPALFVVLFFCLAVSSKVLLPKAFKDFSLALTSTILFSSNLLFWKNSQDYFGAVAELNPLLHTWSLSVEEQFYVIFPIFMSLIWRRGGAIRFAAVATAAILSFAISVWGVASAPTATFYLLPMRAWEMLLGALASFVVSHTTQAAHESKAFRVLCELGGAFGVFIILFSVMSFGPETAFPGRAAFIPCMGAALVILAGASGRSVMGRMLGFPPFSFIGKISYSLYLWHWPLIVFAMTLGPFHEFGYLGKGAILIVSLVLATLSWRYIEEPFRNRAGKSLISRLFVFKATGVCAALLIAAGLAISMADGWSSRFPRLAEVSLERQVEGGAADSEWTKFNPKECFTAESSERVEAHCFLTQGHPSNALLWGDSFAHNYERGLFRNPAARMNVIEYTTPACPPVFDYFAASNVGCKAANDRVEDLIIRYQVRTVFMAANCNGVRLRG